MDDNKTKYWDNRVRVRKSKRNKVSSGETKQASFVTLVVLASIVTVGIVFAAFTGTLNINGTGVVTASKWDIHFENLSEPVITGTTNLKTPAEIKTGRTIIGDYEVIFATPGDSLTYTFDVVNDGDFDATLTSLTKTSPSCPVEASSLCNYLTYTLRYTASNRDVEEDDSLLKGETKNLTLKLVLDSNMPASALPSQDVVIGGLGITMIYSQASGYDGANSTAYNPEYTYNITYTNIEGDYPKQIYSDESLEIDFNGTKYDLIDVYQGSTKLSPLLNYTFEDKVLNIFNISGDINVIYTGNFCTENSLDILTDCIIARDVQNPNVNTAKTLIANKGTPDFSKPEPQVDYEKYITYGVTGNSIASTSNPNITFSTTEPEFNTSTGYYTLKNTFTGKTTDYISDENTKYYTCFSTGNMCLTIYVVYSTRTTVNENTGTETYYLTKVDRYTKKVTDSSLSNPGLYKDEDDYGNTYYYRGDVRNNWVSFGGFMWRIIRINGDGSIRMIYQGSANSSSHTGPSSTIGSAYFGGTRSSFTTETDDISGLTNDRITTTYKGGRLGGTYIGYMFNPDMPISTYPDKELNSSNTVANFPAYTITATSRYYFFKNFNRDTDCFLGDKTKENGACTLKCRKLGTDGEEGVDCVESTWSDLTNKEGNTSSSGPGSTSGRLLFTSDYKYTCWSTSTAVKKINSDGTTSVYVTCPIVSEILGKVTSNAALAYVKYHGLFHTNATDANKNIKDTEIKSKIDTWYQSNILNKTDGTVNLEDYLSDEIFCNDRMSSSSTYPLINEYATYFFNTYTRNGSNRPSFRCLNNDGTFNTNDSFTLKTSGTNSTVASSGIGNKALTYPIGLMTLDEIRFAGIKSGYVNTKTYLHADANIPTMSPGYIQSSLTPVSYYYNLNGIMAASGLSSNTNVRPVINLNPDVLVSGGIGTESDPFKVSLEKRNN